MADARLAASRPLSPHLQVFRFILTMAMSIVHRMTGGFLYVGTVFVAVWLVAAASGPEWFARVDGLYQSWLGRLILLGLVWSLIHHAIGGVRHFIWDLGYGFDKKTADRMALFNLVAGLLLTGVVAVAAFIFA
ncbi:succinate dehydrogenase, cytochrome b556 subunit [Pleomorphomonas carboxyditropha]|uniref:Succinate dehydrogenase cytochrome b556 subunit n=1 Tax=Pleomorphomonas carboxyditropha TaxID=2023338 RepID=A0A2G9WRD8_9HYPH|nr:succinate dehydrogenase, cytochrome b556 subunit [Pleomorphomonas carboxyditropha]PIO97243.1 succinate dehydrogenase, cytochrome b556 subunit [Pleomorphomonas carboxyditropha]